MVTQVGERFGISATTLSCWRQEFRLSNNLEPSGREIKAITEEERQMPDSKNSYAKPSWNGASEKSHRHLLQERREIYQFIVDNRLEFPVEKMFQVLGLSRSGYYRWYKQLEDVEQLDEDLDGLIQRSFETSGGTYGSPRPVTPDQQDIRHIK